MELLSPGGALVAIPYSDVKVVCFVRDFDSQEPAPERKVFNTRPKTDGLWVRMRLRDGDVLEGVLSNDLLCRCHPSEGFTVTPPDAYSNNQKLFVPRAALSGIHVLGVVGSPLTRLKAKPAAKEQIGLFEGQ